MAIGINSDYANSTPKCPTLYLRERKGRVIISDVPFFRATDRNKATLRHAKNASETATDDLILVLQAAGINVIRGST